MHLFQAASMPDKIAVVCPAHGGEEVSSLSYAELNTQANRSVSFSFTPFL